MLKKTIAFKDLDGNIVTDDFYFNLSKAELAEMEMSQKDGLTDYLKKIVAESDGPKLIEMFKKLLTMSIGKRGEDGRQFVKSQAIVDNFVQTDAYSELFVELATNAGSAAAFVKGIVPSDMAEAIDKAEAEGVKEPAWITEGRTPTPEEVKNATPEQLQIAFTRRVTPAQTEIAPTA